MGLNITESEIFKQECGTYVYVEKKLYIECSCGSLEDIARITISRDYKPEPKEPDKYYIVMDDVSVEFNATACSDPSFRKYFINKWDHFIYPFEKAWNRIKGAYNILVGKPVWFPTNLCLDSIGAKELAHLLDKSLKDMENVQIRCNNQNKEHSLEGI